jgi:RNA recognition motif-containing protein
MGHLREIGAKRRRPLLGPISRRFGRVRSARVQRDPATGASKLFGFVVFDDIESAKHCIRESVLLRLDGRPAYVTEKISQADGQREKGPAAEKDAADSRLIAIAKRISEQQIVGLLEDEELFQKWSQSGEGIECTRKSRQ